MPVSFANLAVRLWFPVPSLRDNRTRGFLPETKFEV